MSDEKDNLEAIKLGQLNVQSQVSQTIESLIINQYQNPKPLSSEIDEANRSFFTLPGTHRKNPYFTPKEEVIAVFGHLLAGETLVLCGPPGVGKTQHAVQYAHQNRSQYKMVLWASADSVPGLYQAFTALADIILHDAGSYLVEDTVMALRLWLEKEPNWLLILDNADSLEVVREIERFIPSVHQGIVMITSQITDWTAAFRREHLEVWTDKQTTEFLTQRLPWCAIEQDTFAQLSRELGGLPLALEHAAAYITETKISPSEYLGIMSRDQKRIFRRKYAGMTNYQASIAVTWQLSTRRLGWLARQILQLASCLSSEPIPRSFFSHLLPVIQENDFLCGPFERRKYKRVLMSPDAINLALGELARYSLITLSENTLRLHPLLQLVVLDSTRIRPWQAAYWLSRLWQIGQSKWSLGVGLWLYRTAVILNQEDVLPAYSNNLEVLKMRTFVAHLQALSRNITANAPEIFKKYTVSPIKHKLKWFDEKINEYDTGMKNLRELLEGNARRSPDLMTETEWFVNNVEEFYKQVFGMSGHSDISHNLRWLSGDGEWDIRERSYRFLSSLAERQADLGEIDTAKRLYRFYIAQAMSDPEAPSGEVAHAKLMEVISLLDHWHDELKERLEEALILNEDMNRAHLNVWNALWIYSQLANTSEEENRSHQWIIKALPHARAFLKHGCDHACVLTQEYVRRLEDKKEYDEALLACGETLRLALLSKKLGRKRLAKLWCQRGRLLCQQEQFLTSARSYARCLVLESKYEEITPFRQIDLNYVVGDMYLKANLIPTAKKYLLLAHDLLEKYWSDDPKESGFYALLIGSDLGQVQEEAKGEVMLRRCIESYQKESLEQ
jgi:hypothetical protein